MKASHGQRCGASWFDKLTMKRFCIFGQALCARHSAVRFRTSETAVKNFRFCTGCWLPPPRVYGEKFRVPVAGANGRFAGLTSRGEAAAGSRHGRFAGPGVTGHAVAGQRFGRFAGAAVRHPVCRRARAQRTALLSHASMVVP